MKSRVCVSAVLGLLVGAMGCAADTPAGGSGGGLAAGFGGTGGDGAVGGTGAAGAGAVGGFGGNAGYGAVGGFGATGGTGGAAGAAGAGGMEIFVEKTCNVDAGQAALLTDPNVQVGGGMRWLYPYDFTVFPRGLVAPVLQWEGGPNAQVALLRIRSQFLDLELCLNINEQGRAQIPQGAWDLAGTQSRGKLDPATMELVVAGGGQAAKLPARQATFALASLNSAIYYNTYGSAIAQGMGIVGGVVMRVRPKATEAEVFLASQAAGNCIGCHAVSADGSRIIAEEHGGLGLVEGSSLAFALSATTQARPAPTPTATPLNRAGFSALYPDGSIYLTGGRHQVGPLGIPGFGQPAQPHVTGTFGPEPSKLVDAATGAVLNAPGVPKYALMPMFSVDGTMVAFNRLADDGTGGHTLSVMDFARNNTTFSNGRDVFTNQTLYPGWPFFLPNVELGDNEFMYANGRRLVFALGSHNDFVTQTVSIAPPFPIAERHVSDLWWLDIATGMAAPLGRAGGFEGATNFLPDQDGAHLDYMPTVSPVAAGGYFWVFFSSRRSYGNTYPTRPMEDTGKKIWVAAIDINTPPGSDPSHPAFFLPGQELESGNVRAFAALEPCRGDGASCETGIDCCSGYCIDGFCGLPPEPRCSEMGEICTTAADCCEGQFLSCIGGFCSVVLE